MLAQAGLGYGARSLLGPLFLMWSIAAGWLFVMIGFACILAAIRFWNRSRERRVTGACCRLK